MRPPLLVAMTLVLVACEPRLSLGTSCDLNSQCAEPLVCRHSRCRTACAVARDCPVGLRCVVEAAGSVCSLPPEESCDPVTRPCPGSLLCVDGQCRSECTTDADCTASGRCESDRCVEPPSGLDAGVEIDAGTDASILDALALPDANCTPAPMMCGNGRVDRCNESLDEIARAVTGGASGEFELFAVHELPPLTWPTEGGTVMAPEIALGLTAAGYGVVGHITGGDTREVVLHRFSLSDLTTAAIAPIDRRDFGSPDPPIVNAVSLTLGENGNAVTGFVLDREPPSASGLVAHQLIFAPPGSGGTELPLSAGDPPHITGGHMTIVGGPSSVWGTFFDVYYVTREFLVPTGTPVLGAIDEDISMGTYRSTTSGSLTARFMASSGTAGGVAIFRAGQDVGIWSVARTRTLLDLGGLRPDDLLVVDLDAVGSVAADLASNTGLDYLLAVPTDTVVGGMPVGVTRFFDLICPAIGPCNAPSALSGADLPSRSGRAPIEVHLAGLPGGGHALLALEPVPSAGARAQLRFLDDAAIPTSIELPDPVIPATANPALADVVATEVRVVTTGTLVTVVVAAIVRDYERTQDRIVLAGLRACVTR